MSVVVKYNGHAPWVDDTPYVSISKEPLYVGDNKIAEINIITLDGTITIGSLPRPYEGFNQTTLEGVKNDILGVFSENLGSLEVFDSAGNHVIGAVGPGGNEGENILVSTIKMSLLH